MNLWFLRPRIIFIVLSSLLSAIVAIYLKRPKGKILPLSANEDSKDKPSLLSKSVQSFIKPNEKWDRSAYFNSFVCGLLGLVFGFSVSALVFLDDSHGQLFLASLGVIAFAFLRVLKLNV